MKIIKVIEIYPHKQPLTEMPLGCQWSVAPQEAQQVSQSHQLGFVIIVTVELPRCWMSMLELRLYDFISSGANSASRATMGCNTASRASNVTRRNTASRASMASTANNANTANTARRLNMARNTISTVNTANEVTRTSNCSMATEANTFNIAGNVIWGAITQIAPVRLLSYYGTIMASEARRVMSSQSRSLGRGLCKLNRLCFTVTAHRKGLCIRSKPQRGLTPSGEIDLVTTTSGYSLLLIITKNNESLLIAIKECYLLIKLVSYLELYNCRSKSSSSRSPQGKPLRNAPWSRKWSTRVAHSVEFVWFHVRCCESIGYWILMKF